MGKPDNEHLNNERFQIWKSPYEIEKEFNRICNEINQCILKEDFKIPPQSLFQQLEDEFGKVKKNYEQQNDEINLLHVTHNYLYRKSFQYLPDNPTKSLELIIKAFSSLLDRHRIRQYQYETFEKMLGAYEVALIRINQKCESIDFDRVEMEFGKFIKTYPNIATTGSEKLANIINILIQLFIEGDYNRKISNLKIKSSNFEKIDEIITFINLTSNVLENIYSLKKSYLPSLCYELLYKLRKKQLQFLVEFMFFEKTNEKKQWAQDIINQITEEMISYCKKSLKYSKSYFKNIPTEKQQESNVKLVITLKELDELSASYYKEAYSNKDIFKAWQTMDEIKQFLVSKAFKENIPLSDSLLEYFGEEWSLLYIFAKICLLKEEVNNRTSSVRQEWEKEIFSAIVSSLASLEKLFKYEITDKKSYALKIMTSQFAGGFSEYFILTLCKEFFEYGAIDEKTPSDFKDLLECVKLARNKEDIKLNDVVEKGGPDIDIHVKKKCAIFLKNARIESDEVEMIWREVKLCEKKDIMKVFYGINFIKNLQKIDYIRKSFEKIKMVHNTINIDIYDIKEIVNVFLKELKRSGKSTLNFPELDLYRVLDY